MSERSPLMHLYMK